VTAARPRHLSSTDAGRALNEALDEAVRAANELRVARGAKPDELVRNDDVGRAADQGEHGERRAREWRDPDSGRHLTGPKLFQVAHALPDVGVAFAHALVRRLLAAGAPALPGVSVALANRAARAAGAFVVAMLGADRDGNAVITRAEFAGAARAAASELRGVLDEIDAALEAAS
jgi:hypothetical protein